MMTHLPAHTSADGYHTATERFTEHHEYKGTACSGGVCLVKDYSATKVTRWSYKKAAQDGAMYKGFRKATNYSRIIARLDASGSYSIQQPVYCNQAFSKYGYTYDGQSGYAIAVTHPRVDISKGLVYVSANTVNRARTEALAKVNDQKINLGVALAEAKKTVSMIEQRALSLIWAYRAFRHGAFRHGLRHLGIAWGNAAKKSLAGRTGAKSAADAWMEFQYGWMPLVNDIWGGIEQLREGFKQDNLLFHVERTITEALDPGLVAPTGYSASGRLTESAKATVWCRVKDPHLLAASALGLTDPATIAWELVPYSFVIDWLIPIGTWLQSLHASVGVEWVDSHVANVIEADVEVTRLTYGAGCRSKTTGSLPKARYRLYGFQRVVDLGWPFPLPYVKSPFSTSHVASALALVTQRR